jgi:hypothetical protein
MWKEHQTDWEIFKQTASSCSATRTKVTEANCEHPGQALPLFPASYPQDGAHGKVLGASVRADSFACRPETKSLDA